MKVSATFLSVLFGVLLLSSCAGKDDKKTDGTKKENKKDGLDGAWEIKRAEGAMADLNVGTVYEFSGDKLTFGLGSFKNEGTTVITDSTFSFQAIGNDLKFMYNYHFEGDTLVAEMQGSNGQIFHMVKK